MVNEGSRGDNAEFQFYIEQWNKEAKKLGIVWPISYKLKNDVETCMVVSDESTKTHEIWVHPGVLRQPDVFDVDIMHELSHAKVSETVDPTFSTINFSEHSLKGWDGEQAAEFRKQAGELRMAWLHVDIWINDVRDAQWPELTKKDILNFLESFRKLASNGAKELIQRLDTKVSVAMNISDAKRHLSKNKQPDEQIYLRQYAAQDRQIIVQLTNHFNSLPKLRENKKENLKILEDSVQKVAQILGLSIKPFLLEENGRMVWDFGA